MRDSAARLDPGIERAGLWHTFHAHFVSAIYEALSIALPEHYLTYIEERVVVAKGSAPLETYQPDVRITHADPAREARSRYGDSVPPATPVMGRIAVFCEETQRFIEIRGRDGQLVTVVELLSPSNKRAGNGRRAYLAKRERLLLAGVNLVELDLLLGGRRMPILTPWPDGERAVLVARADTPGTVELYGVKVAEPLPAIRVPLAHPDPDYVIDLQVILTHVWDVGRFDQKLATRDHKG